MQSQSFLPSFVTHAAIWRPLAAALATAAALLCAGCADDPNEQVVQFETTPPGAMVKIDGTPVAGHTPMSAVLGKKRDTHITFEKPGFTPTDVRVHPTGGGDLTPNPVVINLRPDLLPDVPGPNPQAELAKSLEVVREYAEMGRITPEDRVYIEIRLKQFYGQPATPPPPAGN